MLSLRFPMFLGIIWQSAMAMALVLFPHRGTPHALFGDAGTHTFAVLFLCGVALLRFRVEKLVDDVKFVLGTMPIGLYGVLSACYVLSKLNSSLTVSITTPIMFLGGYAALLVTWQLSSVIVRLRYESLLQERCSG